VHLPRLARFLLWIGGWTTVGEVPKIKKVVVIAAPHTSNWDGFWAIVYINYIGMDVSWFVKHTMFWFPLGNLIRAFNGIPLNRSKARGVRRDRRSVRQSLSSTGIKPFISAWLLKEHAAKLAGGKAASTVSLTAPMYP